MYSVSTKEIDTQGRIILPKIWREKLDSNKVVIIIDDELIKIIPSGKKFSSFFDKAKPSRLKTDPFKNFDKALAEATLR
ncbi:AbrB family transcriptional regulator [Candidatus Woesearchaeota archaeon]|nr:AbrB family transcriptional regulator [Candidatus Woesearchaeota archaeon]